MYNEDDEKKVMPIRFFLGILILIIIFVLLLLWLLPMSNIGDSHRLFKTNMEEMKQAAIQYFDMDTLPQNEGETTKVTLGELMDKKYILKVTDKDGKECNKTKSYVSITKKSDDTYEMKTKLRCETEEDYIITNLGHYSYCVTEICEQQGIGGETGNNGNNSGSNTTKLTCSLEVTSGSINENGVYNSNVTVKFKNEKEVTKNESYDITTSKTPSYEKRKQTVITTDGTHTVYGYVRNSEGKTAKCSIKVIRDTSVKEQEPVSTSPTCTLKVKEGQTGKNGWYITNVTVALENMNASNGASISNYGIGTDKNYDGGKEYRITNDGNYKVYGYVKDSKGKTGTCEITINKDSTKPTCSLKVLSGSYNDNGYYNSDIVIGWNSKNDNFSGIKNYAVGDVSTSANNESFRITTIGYAVVYGYVEDNAGNNDMCTITVQKVSKLEYQYSKFISATYGGWSDWTTYEYDITNPPKFGKFSQLETEDLGKTTVIDSYQYSQGDPIYQTVTVDAGTVEQTYCVGYDYYRLASNNTYAVKSTDDWVFSGRVYLTEAPTDSVSAQYKFVGLDWSECNSTCTKAPKKIWDKYTRTVYKATSSKILVDSGNSTITCNKTAKKEVKLITNVRKVASHEQIRTPIYKDTYRYRKRTRNTVTEGYTDYKWSINNDASLLNNGYKLTGNTRVVS